MIFNLIIKSPLGPLLFPLLPLPATLKFYPVFIPLGIVIDSFYVLYAVPDPLQLVQGLLIIVPLP